MSYLYARAPPESSAKRRATGTGSHVVLMQTQDQVGQEQDRKQKAALCNCMAAQVLRPQACFIRRNESRCFCLECGFFQVPSSRVRN